MICFTMKPIKAFVITASVVFLSLLSELAFARIIPLLESDFQFTREESWQFPQLSFTGAMDSSLSTRGPFFLCLEIVRHDGTGFQTSADAYDSEGYNQTNFTSDLDILQTGTEFFAETKEIYYNIKRQTCDDDLKRDHRNTEKFKIDFEEYIALVKDGPSISPFGPFEWGETKKRTTSKMCDSKIFKSIQNREDICKENSWTPIFTQVSNFESRDEWARKLNTLVRRHRDLYFPNDNLQLISSDRQHTVGPIKILGVAYDVQLSYSSISSVIAKQSLIGTETDADFQPACFEVEGTSICEYPPVLTQVSLRAQDSTVDEICNKFKDQMYTKYGEFAYDVYSYKATGTSLERSCRSPIYEGRDYVYTINYQFLHALQEKRVRVDQNDGASGL